MKWINNILNKSAFLLTLVIIITSICIIIVVIFLLFRLQNEKKVTRAALELKKITNSIQAGFVHFVLEDNCRILYASKGFYDILGYDKNETKEQNKNSLMDFIEKGNLEFVQDIKRQFDNEMIRCDVHMYTKDGIELYMLMTGNSITGKDGKHTLSVVFVDITEQKKMQDIILLEGERYRIATELSNDVIFEYHIKKDEMIFSEKYRELFGMNPIYTEYLKTHENRRDQTHPDDWGIYLEFCQDLSEGKGIIEREYRKKDRMGEYIWCLIMGKTIYDDNMHPVSVIGKIVNVDAQKREVEALEYKATRDPLTGVYNKEVTIKKIEKFISGNRNGMHMLMLVDLDDFKSINDNYGHLQGDKILVFVINHIKEKFAEGEIIGRIGGDEFIVFTGNIKNAGQAIEKATILKNELDTIYVNGNHNIPISASIGAVLYPEAGLHYEQLMEQADKALYRVKEQGKNNYMLYSPTI